MADFGARREREVQDLLEAEGWVVTKAGGSLGTFDLMAARGGEMALGAVVRLVEVKGTAAGPYHSFGPEKRQALSEAASRAGGRAELAWWPKRGKLEWLKEREWP